MTQALVDLLALCYQTGNLERMEAIARCMLSAVPNDSVAMQFLGLSLYMRGKTEDAFKLFRRFASASENNSTEDSLPTSCELASVASYRAASSPGSGLAQGWTGISKILFKLGYDGHAARARWAAWSASGGIATSKQTSDEEY